MNPTALEILRAAMVRRAEAQVIPRLVTCCLCRCAFAGTGARAHCWGCYQVLLERRGAVR